MSVSEFHPRPGNLELGGIRWLPRMIDKARAKAGGYIGEYIYPCPIDRRVLQQLGLSPEQFQRIATECCTDEEVLKKIRELGV